MVAVFFRRGRDAQQVGGRGVALAPSSALIRVLLGHALVATENKANIDEAVRELSNAAQREPEFLDAWQHLSSAYGRKGNIGMASYAAAQAYFAAGDYKNAATQASRVDVSWKRGW